MLEILGPRLAGQTTGSLSLPEIAPNRNQLDAKPSGRTTAGKKHLAAVFQRAQKCFLDTRGPARFDEFAILGHDIVIHFEQEPQGGGDVVFHGLAKVRGDRMGRFCSQTAKLKLVADAKEIFRSLACNLAHSRHGECSSKISLRSLPFLSSASI